MVITERTNDIKLKMKYDINEEYQSTDVGWQRVRLVKLSENHEF